MLRREERDVEVRRLCLVDLYCACHECRFERASAVSA